MSEINSYDLPPMLRMMHREEIPDWAREGGYDPATDSQAIVVGDEADLKKWREMHNLDPDKYPIQSSKLGDHIDLYGDDADKFASDRRPFTDIRRN